MDHEIVDVSHIIEDGMVTYPGLPDPRITDHLSRDESRSHYAPGTEFHIGRVEMVANTGTYVDTPSHRYRGGHDLSGLPLERVADVPGIAIRAEDTTTITTGLLDGHELRGRAVLFSTGWDRHWRTDRYGAGGHPHLGLDAAERLIAEEVALVGIDSVNIDDTATGERPIHSILLGAGIPIVEHLTGLGLLVDRTFRFFAVPPPVRGMGTFPVRAFALM